MGRTMKRRWPFILGGFALVWVLGASLPSSQNRWRPFQSTATFTRDFHSPYPWVGVVRHDDGQPGFLVYAPVDQVPCDWPPPMQLVSQHVLGFWQFVLADGTVEPDKTGVRQDNSTPVFDFDGCTPIIMLRARLTGTSEESAAFQTTPAGQQAVQSIP